jgi:AraC family transcriptional regulator
MIEPRFERLPEMDLVGLTVSSYPAGHPNHDPSLIPELWDFLMQLVNATQLKIDGPMYGASIMDGEAMSYLAGFVVDSEWTGEKFPASETWLLPSSRYAIFEHRGKLNTLTNTLHEIFQEWLPASGFEVGPSPCLEIYGESFVDDSDDSIIEIAVPVKE